MYPELKELLTVMPSAAVPPLMILALEALLRATLAGAMFSAKILPSPPLPPSSVIP